MTKYFDGGWVNTNSKRKMARKEEGEAFIVGKYGIFLFSWKTWLIDCENIEYGWLVRFGECESIDG